MGVISKIRGRALYGSLESIQNVGAEVQKKTVTLTAAQVKALFTTPQALVAAPGSGKAHVMVGVFAKHVFLTTAFAGSNSLEFRYTSSNGAKVTADMDASILLATADAYRYVSGVATLQTPVVNAPLVVNVPTANHTQGLGSLKLQVFYRTMVM